MNSPIDRFCSCLRGKIPSDVDWEEIIAVANEHMIAPMLYRRLLSSRCGSQVDEDAMAYLKEIDAASSARNQRIKAMLVELTRALNASDICPVIVKGARDLVQREDPGDVMRLMLDIDILVDEAELSLAIKTLTSCGFQPIENTEYEHSPGSYWRAGDVATVDLHTRLPVAISDCLTAHDMTAHTHVVRCDGATMRVPDASLHMFIHVSHDMLHHQSVTSGNTELRYLAELAEQLETCQEELDWRWIGEKRKSHRAFGCALDLQALMLRHLFGASPGLAPDHSLTVRILHLRRIFKMRWPEMGAFEWRVIRSISRNLRVSNSL